MVGSHRRDKDDPAPDLFDRWMSHRQDEPQPVAVADATEAEPVLKAEPVDVPSPHPPVRSGPPTTGPSTDVEFTPRTRARRLVGALLLCALAGLVAAAIVAGQDPTTLTVGIAAVLLVLTLVLWAIRASSPVAHLAVRAGQLEVVQGGGRFVFDLSGGFTPIEVVGTPGERRWRVMFLRSNMEPYVIDSSMVDPREFMDVLSRYRSE